jgi:hypothetical protein
LAQVSNKLRSISAGDGYGGEGFAHWCPACKTMHAFAVSKPFSNGAKWRFDGNLESPTFEPSMNIAIGPYPYGEGEKPRIDRCHYFLHNGVIQYLADCTHEMTNTSIALPDLPYRYWDVDWLPRCTDAPINP